MAAADDVLFHQLGGLFRGAIRLSDGGWAEASLYELEQ
jgi:hypothetical protein